jgi:hypothetical protein
MKVCSRSTAPDLAGFEIIWKLLWHDEWAICDKLRIHDRDLDPAVGSTRLLAVARYTRVGLAKTLRAHDGGGNPGLYEEVADSFGAPL